MGLGLKKIIKYILNNIEDILIFIGLFMLVLATFLINYIAGIYVIGVVFLLIGFYFIKFPLKR